MARDRPGRVPSLVARPRDPADKLKRSRWNDEEREALPPYPVRNSDGTWLFPVPLCVSRRCQRNERYLADTYVEPYRREPFTSLTLSSNLRSRGRFYPTLSSLRVRHRTDPFDITGAMGGTDSITTPTKTSYKAVLLSRNEKVLFR